MSFDRFHVLHVFGTMNVGGAELRTLELGSELSTGGIVFDYLALSGKAGVLDNEIHAAGGKVHHLGLSVAFPVHLFLLLRRERPRVVDSHVATFSGILLFLAWAAHVPVRVAHFRSDGDGHRSSLRRRLQRRLLSSLIRAFATDIIGVSPASLTHGYSDNWQSDRRARVIPNGLPEHVDCPGESFKLRSKLGISPESLLLMHVGRPSPEKNRPRAVSVLAATRAAGIDAHLALVGGRGVDEPGLARAIEVHRLGDFVHHLGERRDVRNLMKQADAVVLTSTREGLPGVLIEALSVGTPAVSADLPGAAFIQSHLRHLEVQPLDDDSAWIAAIRRCAARTGSPEREEARRQFRQSVFTVSNSGVAHRCLYSQVNSL